MRAASTEFRPALLRRQSRNGGEASPFIGPIAVALACFSALAGCRGPQPEPRRSPAAPCVTTVSSECVYTVSRKRWLRSPVVTRWPVIRHGAGVLLRRGQGTYVMTARHVVLGPAPAAISRLVTREEDGREHEVIVNEKSRITECLLRVRVSTLSLKPERLYLSDTLDIAFLQITPKDAKLLRLTAFDVGGQRPVLGEQVRIWGFPSTANPQVTQPYLVTDILKDFFVLNGAAHEGYSGGPALRVDTESRLQLLGMVVRSDDQQTRCVSGEAILRAFQRRSTGIPYSDGMAAPRRESSTSPGEN